MSKRIRTFIAVEISAPMRRQLGDLQDELAEATEDTKWVEPENLHLTLNFLGDIDEREVYEVCKIVERVAAEMPPFEMTASGVGAFPSARRPRVVWVGIAEGREQLNTIHHQIDRALQGRGYATERRDYTPHLTLGRIRQLPRNSQLCDEIARRADWHGGSIAVHEVLVFASELSSKGPRHTVMGRAPLQGQSKSD